MSLIRILGLTLLLSLSSFAFAGADGDGVPDDSDNCPNISNADQLDTDSDGLGNVCDGDADGDGINYSGFKITNDDPLIGDWRLAGVGSLRVGSAPLDGSWFSIGAAVVLSRACQFDDVFRFNADGSFENVNGEDTWLESWQGGGDEGSCGASLEPHDGVTSAFWEYDVDAGALNLDGLGAYLGLPKVTNEGELPNVAVPDSVSYKVETLSDDGAFMVVTIEAGNGVFWTFEFVRSNGLPIQTKPALFGGWKLAGEGSFRVGPTELDGGWFSPDASVVVERSCLMDDTYIFFPKGDFKNIQNGLTWLEDWQEVGGQAMCGAPVSPHDGNGSASYSYDSTSKLLRLDGVGAYLGIAKAVNAGELSKDVPVPESITYTVDRLAFDSSALTIFIEAGQGVFWTFDFIQISDNCPFVKNIDQLDFDSDGKGDPCDADDDNDGVEDTFDAFPLDATETFDTDNDGTGNNADTDDDGDGVPDTADGYALISLGVLLDTDSDGFPNECDEDCLATGMTADSDDDNDGVEDTSDAFPLDSSLWSLKVEDVLAEISDKNLRGCVEKAVIGLIQVADLTVLDCSERDIVNLTGLQKFIWLTKLELRFNQIADLSSLLNQSNLLELGLQGNPIDWLTFPEGLTGIQILRGNGTKLDSTFRIPSYLALTLKDLDISYQNTDLMDLAGLSLFSKLERLNFSGNPSIDWSSLPALANVTFLGAHGTGLERLSQLLPSAGNLETADLSNNKIIDLALIDQLVELKHLNVAYNEINDISQLENPLITLNLGGNLLADIAPLKIYREASQGELWLWDNPIRRIGDLFIHWKNLRVNFESNVNQTSMELSCQEIEYVNGYIDSTLVITWPSFSPCRNDPDRDYFYGDEDAFPNDPAASVDTDEDGKPDDWHEGRSESDSTSDPALVLDDDDDNDGIDDEIEQANGTNPRNADSDGDALDDNLDNCPSLSNTNQLNTDGDTEGDACDSDDDNDGFSDDQEELDGTNPKSRFSCKSGCFSFDVDESLEAQPLTDGLLVIRHLFGFSGDSLISGAVSGEAGRDSSEAIAGYLTDAVSELDIDGDGESKPLTDGLLLIRYLFGFSGDSLVSGAIGSGAERDTAEEVEAYIQERVPVQ